MKIFVLIAVLICGFTTQAMAQLMSNGQTEIAVSNLQSSYLGQHMSQIKLLKIADYWRSPKSYFESGIGSTWNKIEFISSKGSKSYYFQCLVQMWSGSYQVDVLPWTCKIFGDHGNLISHQEAFNQRLTSVDPKTDRSTLVVPDHAFTNPSVDLFYPMSSQH